jgi:antitoxin component YwqK of YwqJK toxin-antitoxin module
MKTRFILLVLIGLLIGCTSKPEKRVIEKFPAGNPKIVRYYDDKSGQEKMVKEEVFYENKKLQYSGEFKDSLRHGHWIYYYQNGNVWSEGDFKDGLSEGLRKTYFENGQLRYEGRYEKGIMKGLWKFYSQDGKLSKQINADTLRGNLVME